MSMHSSSPQQTAKSCGRADPIAIIGLGCRFPGANSPAEFWAMLRDGVDAITDVPRSRFDVDSYYAGGRAKRGRMVTRRGGFLKSVDCFDAAFFDIEPREAVRIDPQHRLVLETAWETLEDAAIPPHTLVGSRTGVFVGMCYNDYEDLLFSSPNELNLHSMTGGSRFSAAGRVSFALGLEGPSMVVDTACSSSLAAVHLACQSLRNGESTLALAGGVNVILEPYIHICLSRGSAAAPDGRTKFGDAAADGYVRSEGVALVALKRLEDALRDGDRIEAVILGSALRHKGRGGDSLATPQRDAVVAVMRDAYESAGVSPADVQYIEAHGTGTRLGDAAEIPAIADVLRANGAPARRCCVGSVKTNIGHTESAAGVAGLIKTVLSMRNRQIPPSLHFGTPSAKIDWTGLPIEIPTSLRAWPADGRILAGINSFGMSGTNAHMVVEGPAALPTRSPQHEAAPHVLCLSARTDDALRELARRFADHLETTSDSLADVCYTALHGRTHFALRVAVVGDTTRTISAALHAFSSGEGNPGDVLGDRETIPLARQFVAGSEIEGTQSSNRRVSLPTYPFEQTRFWCSTTPPSAAVGSTDSEDDAGVRRRMADEIPSRRQDVLNDRLSQMVAEVSGLDPATPLDRDRPLHELGFDSMRAVELRERLVAELGCDVPVTVVFDHPTIERMGRYLSGLMTADENPPAAVDSSAESDRIDELQALPERELEALLLRKLESIESRGER